MEYISSFVGWFLENFTSEEVSVVQLTLTLGLASMNAVYIFLVYRMMTRKTFYSKGYNITVAGVAVIVTAIIFTVQSSIVLSLGVIGALAIVRFRTVVKDALDLVFLFWAVVTGVCCGAHMSEISLLLSAVLTLLILGLDSFSTKRGYFLLLIEAESEKKEGEVLERIRQYCKKYKVKTREEEKECYKFVVELKVKKELELVQKLSEIAGLHSISFIAQEGEHNY